MAVENNKDEWLQAFKDKMERESKAETQQMGTEGEADEEVRSMMDMIEIVVNDALLNIDVIKKYPAFFARMLVDEELRTAFLDTMELLEQSSAGELTEGPEAPGLDSQKALDEILRPNRRNLKSDSDS